MLHVSINNKHIKTIFDKVYIYMLLLQRPCNTFFLWNMLILFILIVIKVVYFVITNKMVYYLSCVNQ